MMNSQTMKKAVAAALALCMAGAVTACGSGGGSASSGAAASGAASSTASASGGEGGAASGALSAPGEFPITTEPIEFKIVTQQTDYILDPQSNDFTKYYEEKTGVKVNYELVPQSAVTEKVNLILASNNLPDAFMGVNLTTTDQVVYGTQGSFLNLADYIQSIGFYAKQALDDAALNTITAPDGGIYALPSVNACYHCFYSGRAWINKQWLDNLGLAYPETTEDFYNVLKAFKEQDANGNGDPGDEIPMMGCDDGWNTRPFDFLLNSFVYNDYDTRVRLNNGKVEFVANTDAYKEGLRYIRQLVADGLLDPVSLTQTGEQFKVIGGDPENIRVGVALGATWWSGLGDDVTDTLQRSRQYVGLSPLKGPQGVRNVLTNTSDLTAGQFAITGQCKNPEALFRWADGLYDDEVTVRSQLGTEGVGWKTPETGALGINGQPALYEVLLQSSGGEEVRNDWMCNIVPGNRTSEFRLGQATGSGEEAQWDTETRLYNETHTYFEPYTAEGQYLPSLILTSEEAEERTALETQIKAYALENTVAFLAGNRDIDKEWDAYVGEYENLGLARYIELLQSAYDRQYGNA